MARRSRARLATISLMVCAGAANVAAADNSVGFYGGGGIGYGAPQNTFSVDSEPPPSAFQRGYVNAHTFGWDALVGIRPVKWVGAEVQYLDFGRLSPQFQPVFSTFDAHNYAAAAFAVGYLPLPHPWPDLFGKVGAAEYWGSYRYSYGTAFFPCDPSLPCNGTVHTSETDLAYGGGMQVRLGAFAVRLEYDAIDVKVGTPSLILVGVTWTP